MIEVRHLTKRFSNTLVVNDLSFRIESGQTLALIGSSGSGKTTTLRMINRLVEPDTGQILVNGQDVTRQPLEQLRRQIGYVIQNTGLFPHYTVAENIAIVPNLLRWPPDRIHRRVYELLEHVGLPPSEYASKYPEQLSGGQQQRVGLARALAANPPAVLMDEPFGALDPLTRRRIRQEMLQLEEFRGKTVILVTHDVEEAFALADVICLLHRGAAQQIGTPADLLHCPANDFVAAFFAEQKLQLSWMVLSLGEVFAHLSTASPGGRHYLPCRPETKLRQALELLNEHPNQTITVTQRGETRYCNLETLLVAQRAFTKTLST